jgi:hypothetical protein
MKKNDKDFALWLLAFGLVGSAIAIISISTAVYLIHRWGLTMQIKDPLKFGISIGFIIGVITGLLIAFSASRLGKRFNKK